MSQERVVCVDFDGTLVEHRFPEIGDEVLHAVRVIKRLTDNDIKIIIWTMRHAEYLHNAKEWCESKGIEVWAYNINPNQKDWTGSSKAYGQAYIDDAAIGCPLIHPIGQRPYVDWMRVEDYLEFEGFFN